MFTSDSLPASDRAHRMARPEIAALCVGSALGYLGQGAQPLWVAAFISDHLFAASDVGWLASGELVLIALSTLAVSAWGQRLNPRIVAVTAALLIAVGNGVAILPEAASVVLGRLLSGVATGALLSSITGIAARRQDAQRVLALIQGAGLLFGSVVYFMSPTLVGRHGPGGLFALVGCLGIFAAMVCQLALANRPATPTQSERLAGISKLAPLLGCLALASVAMGMNTVWTYIITIGNGLGFNAPTMGKVLAVVGPLALLGPVASHLLGERAGLLRPLLVGLAVLAVDFFLIVAATSPVLLGLYSALLFLAAGFSTPYAIALVSKVDASGRFASAAPAFIMIGGAVGPKLGSGLVGPAHFQMLAAVAAGAVVVSILLFIALNNALFVGRRT